QREAASADARGRFRLRRRQTEERPSRKAPSNGRSHAIKPSHGGRPRHDLVHPDDESIARDDDDGENRSEHEREKEEHEGACKFLCVTDLGVVSDQEITNEAKEENEEQGRRATG